VNMSAHEQRILSGMADELAASDPKLASILSVFNRLTRGEELPIPQDTAPTRPTAPVDRCTHIPFSEYQRPRLCPVGSA
jgi:hypothetical protein